MKKRITSQSQQARQRRSNAVLLATIAVNNPVPTARKTEAWYINHI